MTLKHALHNLATNGRNRALTLPDGDAKKAILETFREIRFRVATELSDLTPHAEDKDVA